jgi:heme-degrading monooxygenase HmoA
VQPGAATIRLFRDVRNPGRFVSLGQWDDADAVSNWKSSPEFKERLGRVVKRANEFEPTEHVTMVQVAGGSAETLSPPDNMEAIHAPT